MPEMMTAVRCLPGMYLSLIHICWQECSSATVPEFSSVAYFYARKLWKELNVPVGVIDCTWGGTPAESWTSHQTLKQVMGFQKKMAEMESAGFQSCLLYTSRCV